MCCDVVDGLEPVLYRDRALLRRTIVNRNYATHKNLYIPLLFLVLFGPI